MYSLEQPWNWLELGKKTLASQLDQRLEGDLLNILRPFALTDGNNRWFGGKLDQRSIVHSLAKSCEAEEHTEESETAETEDRAHSKEEVVMDDSCCKTALSVG